MEIQEREFDLQELVGNVRKLVDSKVVMVEGADVRARSIIDGIASQQRGEAIETAVKRAAQLMAEIIDELRMVSRASQACSVEVGAAWE